jgi:hypothetical protein
MGRERKFKGRPPTCHKKPNKPGCINKRENGHPDCTVCGHNNKK